jgi:hypothetical protein
MRPIFIRLIAGILLIYGLAGLAVSLWGANQAAQLFGDARATLEVTSSVDSSLMARTIGRTLGSAASASSAGSESLIRAQESIRAGSASAAELSNAMSALGNDLSFELFGTRPFADVVDPIRRSSQNLSTLASSLTTTEQSLNANRQSFDELGRELRDLESQSNQVADRIAAATENRALSRTISSAEWLANLVIGGFALQSVLFLAIGYALWLVAPPRLPAVVPPLDGE